SYHSLFLLIFFFFFLILPPPTSTLFPYTTLFRSLVFACVALVPMLVQIVERLRHARGVLGEIERGDLTRQMEAGEGLAARVSQSDRKSTRLNSSHVAISYAVFCLKKKKKKNKLIC